MHNLLFEYEMKPTTWVYLSSLLTIGIFFKFRRFWSLRNLDLLALIALSPALLLVTHEQEALGYAWLFIVGALFMVRLLVDPVMVRRPLLEPNLSADGLTFTGAALLVFLLVGIVHQPPSDSDIAGAQRWEQILARRTAADSSDLTQHGPGYPLFYILASLPNRALAPADSGQPEQNRRHMAQVAAARTTAVIAHLALVLGLVLIGYRHFGSLQSGVSVATLYLLLPYTAQMTAHVDHSVPAALMVWAIASYRRPMPAGIFVGLAAGTVYYPIFLLPLWCGFYWRRGLFRFLAGVGLVFAILIASLAITSSSFSTFLLQLGKMFDWVKLPANQYDGFWKYFEPAYRYPVVAAFAALCVSFAFWPVQKNLGTLISASAAVMLGIQFCRANQGGLYMAWYLPPLLLTIFRPNLEDRMALTAVIERTAFWRRNRRGVAAAGPPPAAPPPERMSPG